MFFSLVLKVGLLSEEVEGILSSELKALYTYNTAQLSVALVCTLLASIIVAGSWQFAKCTALHRRQRAWLLQSARPQRRVAA